ncbi:hypothetical protein D3C85_1542000 [compost metagenome]
MHVEQHHVQLLGLLQIPAVIINGLVGRTVPIDVPRWRTTLEPCVGARQVITCTEVFPGAFEDDDVNVVAIISLQQGITQFGEHRRMQSISLVRTIQGNSGDAVFDTE